MEQDIAVASVADTVLRRRGGGGGGGGNAPEASSSSMMPGSPSAFEASSSGPLVERFESLHQKVAQAADQVARGHGGGGAGHSSSSAARGPLLSWGRLRRPTMWALAGAVLVGALAVWMRPALVAREGGGGSGGGEGEGGEGESEDAALAPLKVAAVAAGAGLLVGGADLLVGR
jgi:hypothetical protein